jgi:hypothetical protein
MGLTLVMHIGDVLGWSGRLVRGAPMIIHQKSSARSGFYPNSPGFSALASFCLPEAYAQKGQIFRLGLGRRLTGSGRAKKVGF